METIVIGKPAINIYLPLQEFPVEGDIFTIRGKNESLGNIGATAACLLAKWKIPVNYTGVIGNDGYGELIKQTFKEYKVNTKFLETNFEKGTSVNYIILNVKNGISSKILYNDPEAQLIKYKYDFVPTFAILDGTDFAGAQALLNNNGSIKSLFYARVGDKDTIAMSKRCTWVVCTETFATMLTKETPDGSAEGYVNLYQKIVDTAGNSNYIVILNNRKILYCIDGKVKMLPEMKMNALDNSSFDSVFVGALGFCLMNDVNLDDAIKFADTAAALSLQKIGEVSALPEIDEVLDNSGLREKLGFQNKQYGSAPAPQSTIDLTAVSEKENYTPAPQAAPEVAEQTVDAFNQQAQTPVPQETPVQMPQTAVPEQVPVQTPQAAVPEQVPVEQNTTNV